MKIFSLFITIILAGSLNAQDIARVRKHIDTLAAPGMHGRGYTHKGDKIAAKYIQDQYRELGLHAFPDTTKINSIYFQYFNLNVNLFDFVTVKFDNERLEFGKDYLIHPASPTVKRSCTKIKYLDTLLFSDSKFQNKFLKQNLQTSALVFPSSYVKKIFALPKNIQSKIFEAGFLIELVENKLVYSVASHQYKAPYLQVKKECFEKKKIKKIEFGAHAYLENYKTQNVIGYIKGKSLPDSFIVISAHYDHLGRIGKAYFPGANDNASGISMMLELARHYALPENQPEYSVVFMAFGAEEAGLVGSKHFVEKPLFPLKKIKFLINLDLLGTGDEGITVVNATKFPDQFSLLTKINEEKKYLAAVKSRGPAPNSDHYYFTEKGVPAFFIYTMGGIAAYHDIYDRPETLPLTKFQEVFKLLTSFIEKL